MKTFLKISRAVVLISAILSAPALADVADSSPKDYKPQILKGLETSLKDPDSLKLMQVCPPKQSKKDPLVWIVRFSLNAKNSYGGYSGARAMEAHFKDGKILYIHEPSARIQTYVMRVVKDCPVK